MPDSSKFTEGGGSSYDGDPPMTEDPDTTGMFSFGDITFEDLAATADVVLADGETVSTVQPSYNADGSCKTTDRFNWGDPKNPGQPCSNWFPVIYAEGNLTLNSNDAGQGILLVQGDLQAKGGFDWFGPVMVKGKLTGAGNFKFNGGVRAKKADMATGTSQIYFSNCVLERALSHSAASRPRPLNDRPWFHSR
jgi:hypothetical protein